MDRMLQHPREAGGCERASWYKEIICLKDVSGSGLFMW